MMLQTVILAVALVTISGPVAAIVYNLCQLPEPLTIYGITSNMPDWLCLIMAASGGNTTLVAGPNSIGSYFYGLFQISSRYWCGLNGPGGDCNIACSNLADNYIGDDIACALKIYEQQGFSAWEPWVAKCKSDWYQC